MGSGVTIHANPSIPWHVKRGAFIAEGFRAAGIDARFTSDRFRHEEDGLPVLLGTNFWKAIEHDGGQFLLVDRCSFGDTETFVSLVFNGHGRRGDHRVPESYDASRWERYGVELKPWRTACIRTLLCGQIESFSPHWPRLEDWYASCKATHFRPHPAGINPTQLPTTTSFNDVGEAVTLNSSVGVWCVMNGIRTQVHDEGSMAWEMRDGEHERLPWCWRLAWTQWTDQELREGTPWASLW